MQYTKKHPNAAAPPGQKWCNHCHRYLELDEFKSAKSDKIYSYCKQGRKEKSRQYHAENYEPKRMNSYAPPNHYWCPKTEAYYPGEDFYWDKHGNKSSYCKAAMRQYRKERKNAANKS